MRLLSSRHIFIGVLVFLTLGINAVVAYFNINQLIAGNRQIVRTVTVVSELENLAATLKEAEAAQRGYVTTGKPDFLENFKSARVAVDASLQTLAGAASDEQQQKRLPPLQKAIAARMEGAQTGINLRQTQGLKAASAWNEGGQGARQTKEINGLLDEMRGRENELVESRTFEAAQAADDATRTFWIETAVTFGFLALISYLLGRAARQNRELKSAYDDIARAEAMRDNLTAMLVHDLRTPLTGLLGPLQMLEAQMLGPLDETQKEVVHISNQSGQRLLGMVNALLDVSKMEAGEFTIARQTIEIEPLLERAVRAARPIEDVNTAPIGINCNLQLASADPDLLERVLINLLGNALKFTPPTGKITLSVVPEGERARFAVRDTGPGIAPEFQSKIFEKFGQVESRAKGHKFSTGLGLTFCKLAVEAHGGRIGVQSEVGKGATFWFVI